MKGKTPPREDTNVHGRKYPRGQPIPNELRNEIVDLHRAGVPYALIQRLVGVSGTCVDSTLRQYRKTGSWIKRSRGMIASEITEQTAYFTEKFPGAFAAEIKDK